MSKSLTLEREKFLRENYAHLADVWEELDRVRKENAKLTLSNESVYEQNGFIEEGRDQLKAENDELKKWSCSRVLHDENQKLKEENARLNNLGLPRPAVNHKSNKTIPQLFEQIDKLKAENEKLKENKIDYVMNLLNTPLNVFGGRSALETLGRGTHSIHYVRATFRRVGFSNPLEQENQKLRERVGKLREAVQEHAEGGNIENYSILSDRLEALAPGDKESI